MGAKKNPWGKLHIWFDEELREEDYLDGYVNEWAEEYFRPNNGAHTRKPVPTNLLFQLYRPYRVGWLSHRFSHTERFCFFHQHKGISSFVHMISALVIKQLVVLLA